MSRKFDFAVLGGGPTALKIMDRYLKKEKNAKGLLLNTPGNEGAYEKGSKVVNRVITKLPDVNMKEVEKYKYVANMAELSERLLKEEFRSSPAYVGDSSLGFRCCKTDSEFEALRSVPSLQGSFGSAVTRSIPNFIQSYLGKKVNPELVFPYPEHLWNVPEYIKILQSRIPPENMEPASRIIYEGQSRWGVKLRVFREEDSEIIYVQKVLVCRGIGNIEFERGVKQRQDSTLLTERFNVLSFYKRNYFHTLHLPRELSSILLPEDGICITNELQARHGIMYDTNAKLYTADKFNQEVLDVQLDESRNKISQLYPTLSLAGYTDFICSLSLDPAAFNRKPDNHFRFIVSPSVDPNIRYFNLPYFTAIVTAANNLSDLNSI